MLSNPQVNSTGNMNITRPLYRAKQEQNTRHADVKYTSRRNRYCTSREHVKKTNSELFCAAWVVYPSLLQH